MSDRVRSVLTRPLGTRGTWVGFAIAAALAAIMILYAYRGLTFFYDEWDFVQDRRGWGPNAFLTAHNEHFVAFPAFIFKVWFVIFGLGSYWPYAVLAVACHILCAGVLLALVRTWASNEAALAAAIAVLFFGTAFEVLLWPFEIEVTLCLALGLGAMLALRRRTRRWDVVAAVLLVLAIASSSLAIPLTIGSLVLIAMQRQGWRRLWVGIAPLLVYAVWYLKYGHSDATLSNARYIPEYASKQAAAALHAITGLPPEFGAPLAIMALVITFIALARRWACREALVPILVALAVMWSFLTLSRYGIAPPESSRYLYPASVLLLAVATAIIGRRALTTITARAAIVVILAISITTNLSELAKSAQLWRDGGGEVRASLGALNEVRSLVPGSFQPQAHWAPQVEAGKFFDAEDQFGSTAYTPAEIMGASEAARADADTVLFTANALAVANGTTGTTACRRIVGEAGQPASTTVDIPRAGLVVRATGADAAIHIARYSVLGVGEPKAIAAAGGAAVIIRPRIALSAPPWRAQVTTAGVATICTAT